MAFDIISAIYCLKRKSADFAKQFITFQRLGLLSQNNTPVSFFNHMGHHLLSAFCYTKIRVYFLQFSYNRICNTQRFQ